MAVAWTIPPGSAEFVASLAGGRPFPPGAAYRLVVAARPAAGTPATLLGLDDVAPGGGSSPLVEYGSDVLAVGAPFAGGVPAGSWFGVRVGGDVPATAEPAPDSSATVLGFATGWRFRVDFAVPPPSSPDSP